MTTLQNINYLESIKRWRLSWIIISISSLVLMMLAIFDPIYEAFADIDIMIDAVFFLTFFSLFLIGLNIAYKTERTLRRLEHSELPPGFYQDVTEKAYCPYCGHRLGAGVRYCEYCGNKPFR